MKALTAAIGPSPSTGAPNHRWVAKVARPATAASPSTIAACGNEPASRREPSCTPPIEAAVAEARVSVVSAPTEAPPLTLSIRW